MPAMGLPPRLANTWAIASAACSQLTPEPSLYAGLAASRAACARMARATRALIRFLAWSPNTRLYKETSAPNCTYLSGTTPVFTSRSPYSSGSISIALSTSSFSSSIHSLKVLRGLLKSELTVSDSVRIGIPSNCPSAVQPEQLINK